MNEINPHFVKIISHWGNAASGALFEPACHLFYKEGIEGLIGYRMEGDTAIVFGDPVCSPDQRSELMKAFRCYLDKVDNIIFTIVSDEFASWFMQEEKREASLIQFGEELIVDPQSDPTLGAIAETLRRKLRHARGEGVIVHEYLEGDPSLKNEIEKVGLAWLKKRKGAQIYISHVNLFASHIGRRWFYAERAEEIVGVALLLKRESEEGWFLNRLMTTPNAPHGTSETLVISVLKALREEGCHFLSLGVVPGERLSRIENMGKISSFFIRNIYKLSKRIFHFDGLQVFWKKFQPRSKPLYILFHPKITFHEIKALIRAMNASWTP